MGVEVPEGGAMGMGVSTREEEEEEEQEEAAGHWD